jgi:hypothetical protein
MAAWASGSSSDIAVAMRAVVLGWIAALRIPLICIET